MTRYLTLTLLVIATLLALDTSSPQSYMLRLKNFLAPFTTSAASNMVHSKPPPAPTVQTALKEKEGLAAGEGVETAVFANGCFVSPTLLLSWDTVVGELRRILTGSISLSGEPSTSSRFTTLTYPSSPPSRGTPEDTLRTLVSRTRRRHCGISIAL